jgi:hypothetical protein
MNYDEIQVEHEVNTTAVAAERKELQPLQKRETMTVRLAALNNIVHELQVIVKNDKELTVVQKYNIHSFEIILFCDKDIIKIIAYGRTTHNFDGFAAADCSRAGPLCGSSPSPLTPRPDTPS